MEYYILSYTHKNTDISFREKLVFEIKDEKTKTFLFILTQNEFIQEAVILSTCNRTEFILSTTNYIKAEEFLLKKLHDYSKISIKDLKEYADSYENMSAIHHLFSVASSLDSLVVGETQISGQLKEAFRFSYELGCCGLALSRVIHFAFRCAASVRKTTNISKNSVSVASAAVAKAKHIFKDLTNIPTLVIGAGEMSVLCIKHLLNHHAEIILINRDLKNAQAIYEKTLYSIPQAKISIKSFEDIREWINKTPLLFTATSAPYSIIHQDLVQSLEQDRYWFDLAVPRDIKGIHEENIKVFTIDDLEDIVKKNLTLRENQAKIAYGIVGNFTQEFLDWINRLNIEPLIKTIRQQAKESAQSELAKGIAKGFLPKEYEKNIEKTLHNTFNIFLHDFTVRLRSIANTPQSDSIVEAIQFLFNKEKNPLMLEQYKCEYTENKLTDKEK